MSEFTVVWMRFLAVLNGFLTVLFVALNDLAPADATNFMLLSVVLALVTL